MSERTFKIICNERFRPNYITAFAVFVIAFFISFANHCSVRNYYFGDASRSETKSTIKYTEPDTYLNDSMLAQDAPKTLSKQPKTPPTRP